MSNTLSKAFRLPKLSRAPALIKLSNVFLLTTRKLTRLAKSSNDLNSPCAVLSLVITSMAALPTFLIAESPKRIPLFPFIFSMLKPVAELLTSGGRTGIFILAHSVTAAEILSGSSDSALITAVINSTG